MGKKNEMEKLHGLWCGFWSPRVVLTANNLRVFDQLMEPRTADEVASQISTNMRATEILLDALTCLELIKKRGNKYHNATLARKYLVKGCDDYMGDIIRYGESLWQSWSHLDEIVRSGKPYCEEGWRDYEAFTLGMHNLSSQKAPAFLKKIGLSGVKTALDLGGGPGTYSIAMARQGIAVTLFDQPFTIPIARKIIASEGVTGISFIEGDFVKDDIGSGYDLILASQICHCISDSENQVLMHKCSNALNAGGRLVIQEFVLDKDHTTPLSGALFSVNMLVSNDGGRSYSPDEISTWLINAGLSDIRIIRQSDTVLVSSRLPLDRM
jgi:2-polyprenyl-3-methyl-5-hydroxy-6-metoxy-1,4-benzoquinol methylase